MTLQFKGESRHKVDSKGRVSIPAGFRRVLELGDPDWSEGTNPRITIVYGGASQNYLQAYAQDTMDEVNASIKRLPRGSTRRRALEMVFHTKSHPTTVDETGRLVLSQKLKDEAGIDKEAVFAGSGDTFYIWAPAAYDKASDAIDTWIAEQGEDFDPLSLLSDDEEGLGI